ncbi:MAG: S8 family serine peptidase, partial [Tissierellia bacterium]|nr:S8 family serine peptidase [Tissierellia bacterium]
MKNKVYIWLLVLGMIFMYMPLSLLAQGGDEEVFGFHPNQDSKKARTEEGSVEDLEHQLRENHGISQYEADTPLQIGTTENRKVQALLQSGAGRYTGEDRVILIVEPKTEEDLISTMQVEELSEGEIEQKVGRMDVHSLAAEARAANLIQDRLIGKMRSDGIEFELMETRMYYLMNAFIVKTTFEQGLQIAERNDVEDVYLSEEYKKLLPTSAEVHMENSKDIIKATEAWRDFGVKGEGMVVAVIDSGMDPNHEAMQLSDPSTAAITKDDVEAFRRANNNDYFLDQAYWNPKVPVGFAIAKYDLKEETIASHGMHVAGTIAGNFPGNPTMGKPAFYGVAPEAQLIGINVFTHLGSTRSEYYLKALDYAFAFRADAVNMSLGRSVGTEQDIDPSILKALEKLASLGTIVAISAGNDGTVGFEIKNPPAENMDYGVIADPSLIEASLSVASMENTKVKAKKMDVQVDDGSSFQIPYRHSDNSSSTTETEPLEVVFCGQGFPQDFEGKDVSGKAVLVERGIISFEEKAGNALRATPKGQEPPKLLISYNNVSDELNRMSMGEATLRAVSTGKSHGLKIRALLEQGKKVTLRLTQEESFFDNGISGEMSTFSSWGPTPNYGFKPEITGPGGKIISTFNSVNGISHYGEMSGTSMSSPHLAGAAVLLKQKLMKDRGIVRETIGTEDPTVNHTELKHLIKNILMSTAVPIKDKVTGAHASPRQQGAGVANIHGALLTKAYLYDPTIEPRTAKINLKNIEENVSFPVAIQNFGDKDLTYRVSYTVQTDEVDQNGILTLRPKNLYHGEIGDKVTVKAQSSKTISVAFSLQEMAEELKNTFPNGCHIDGFVVFTPADEEQNQPELSIPFMGFFGDWERLPMTEESIYDLKEKNKMPHLAAQSNDDAYAFTHLYTEDFDVDGFNYYRVLGAEEEFSPKNINLDLIHRDKIAISPNQDRASDTAIYRANMYRNYQIEIEILEEKNGKEKVIAKPDLIDTYRGTKNFHWSRTSTGYSFWSW